MLLLLTTSWVLMVGNLQLSLGTKTSPKHHPVPPRKAVWVVCMCDILAEAPVLPPQPPCRLPAFSHFVHLVKSCKWLPRWAEETCPCSTKPPWFGQSVVSGQGNVAHKNSHGVPSTAVVTRRGKGCPHLWIVSQDPWKWKMVWTLLSPAEGISWAGRVVDARQRL